MSISMLEMEMRILSFSRNNANSHFFQEMGNRRSIQRMAGAQSNDFGFLKH